MESISPNSDARNLLLEMLNPLEGLNDELESFSQKRTCEKVAYIALGAIAVVAGLALAIAGTILLKPIFPLGIFAAAAVPITAAVKAQIGTYALMIIGGFGLTLTGAASLFEGARL